MPDCLCLGVTWKLSFCPVNTLQTAWMSKGNKAIAYCSERQTSEAGIPQVAAKNVRRLIIKAGKKWMAKSDP
jgi:hypothetical protein